MILRKKNLGRGYQPQILVSGRHYFQMHALQGPPNEPVKAASTYILDPQMQLTVRHQNLYLPDSCTQREKEQLDIIRSSLSGDLIKWVVGAVFWVQFFWCSFLVPFFASILGPTLRPLEPCVQPTDYPRTKPRLRLGA